MLRTAWSASCDEPSPTYTLDTRELDTEAIVGEQAIPSVLAKCHINPLSQAALLVPIIAPALLITPPTSTNFNLLFAIFANFAAEALVQFIFPTIWTSLLLLFPKIGPE